MNTKRYTIETEVTIKQSFEFDVDMDAFADWHAGDPGVDETDLDVFLQEQINDGAIQLPDFDGLSSEFAEAEVVAIAQTSPEETTDAH